MLSRGVHTLAFGFAALIRVLLPLKAFTTFACSYPVPLESVYALVCFPSPVIAWPVLTISSFFS